MKKNDYLFLDALKCSLNKETVRWDENLALYEWKNLLYIAKIHDVIPLIIQAVHSSDAFLKSEKSFQESTRKQARERVIFQATATVEFQLLYSFLRKKGLFPVVMKGIVLRSIYPYPELRPSSDEDLLVPPSEFLRYHQAMIEYGLDLVKPDEDIENTYEVAYQDKEKHLYIEIHKELFPPGSNSYGELNSLFPNVFQRTVKTKINGQSIRTLHPTDHLLYLICHAYKHFLHGGFGIRQVCDIMIFSKVYNDSIDWERVKKSCESKNILYFTSALYKIGMTYLGINISEVFDYKNIDEKHLLKDITSGGLYGVADINRAHSSTMTLDVVAARNSGRKPSGLLGSVFLPLNNMQGKFTYLKKHPYLLPVAWGQRVFQYFFNDSNNKNNIEKTIRIANKRIQLLKEYKIID